MLFAQSVADITPETWLNFGEKYGWPAVCLTVFLIISIWGIRSVWKFTTPHINSIVEATKEMLGKQSEFIDGISRHQEELKSLIQTGQGGHEHTHEKLARIEKRTEDIDTKLTQVHGWAFPYRGPDKPDNT